MKKVTVATDKPFAKEAVDKIRDIIADADFELALLEKYTEHQQLVEAAQNTDALIIRSDKVDAQVLRAGNRLKIVVRAGAGYDNVDLSAATETGVIVMNTPGQNSNAVAELAFGMMLFMNRNRLNSGTGAELRCKKLGIHAFGNVGKFVARIALGFGMDVYAFDAFVPKEVIEKEGVKALDSVEELYSMCQYISLHIPANTETKASINYNLLNMMPHGATLVNTARKEVIHEDDLLKIMEERPDFRYISDIEPSKKAEFSEKFANRIFFTPKKMGAETGEANINAGVAAARQIVNFFENGDETFRVN